MGPGSAQGFSASNAQVCCPKGSWGVGCWDWLEERLGALSGVWGGYGAWAREESWMRTGGPYGPGLHGDEEEAQGVGEGMCGFMGFLSSFLPLFLHTSFSPPLAPSDRERLCEEAGLWLASACAQDGAANEGGSSCCCCGATLNIPWQPVQARGHWHGHRRIAQKQNGLICQPRLLCIFLCIVLWMRL